MLDLFEESVMAIDNTHASIASTTNLKQMTPRVREATAAELAAYTGTKGELWYDTTNDVIKYMDGSTAGGLNFGSVTSLDPYGNSTPNEWHAFRFFFRNSSGTFQNNMLGMHLSGSPIAPGLGAAPESLTNTPTGADASTAFGAAGCKISTVTTNRIIFDTSDLATTPGAGLFGVQHSITQAGIGFAGLVVRTTTDTSDVNGVTASRLAIDFYDENNAAVVINTTNFGSNQPFEMMVTGWLPTYSAPT